MKNQSPQFKELSVELTHKCVFNCIFCSSSASDEPTIDDELDYYILKKVIRECIKKFNINIVSLSGGEPLIYQHFHRLIKFILKNKLDILIYTTGCILIDGKLSSWPNSFINSLIKLQQKYSNQIYLIFDIQASDEKNYEKITRVKNSFSLMEDTLKKLKKIEVIKKSSHFVPFKFNWKLIEDTLKFCLNYNLDNVKILRFVDQGRASKFVKLELDIDEFYTLQQNLIVLKEKYKEKLVLGHPIDFLFLIHSKYEIRPCRGGVDAPIILPNGNVYPCPAWKNMQELCAGNIYKQSFEEIWEGSFFILFRRFIEEEFKNIKGLCSKCYILDLCKGKCVAQRILKYCKTKEIPKCLNIGPDPLCLRLKKKVV